MSDFNEQIIAEFRAGGGHVETMGFGDGLVLLHSTGAQSGEERISPVAAIPQVGGTWLIAASAAGGPRHPAWYHNLVTTPEASVEVGVNGVVAEVEVRARDLQGAERDAAWAQFTSSSAGFASYEAKAAPRIIPVLELTPVG